MRKKRMVKVLLGACLALWGLTLPLPSANAAPADADGDGVADRRDLCTPTPAGDILLVDADGCSDRDGDGVSGHMDQCPGTPLGAFVDADGCSPAQLDNDGDGYTQDTDCDDGNFAVNPGAAETCDGIDNNCDGTVDEGCGGGAADADGDGFGDSVEQAGISLPAGMTLADGATTFLPPCTAGVARALCVDSASPDVFVIIDRGDGCAATNACGQPCSALFNIDGDAENDSNIPLPASYPAVYAPFNPLIRVDEAGGGGLGVTTHEILQPAGGSQVIADHFAVRIIEDLDPCTGSILGISTPGVPAEGVQATVFTAGIIRWIGETCNEVTITDRKGNTSTYTPQMVTSGTLDTFVCRDGTSGESISLPGGSLDTIYYRLIANIFVHEFGHVIDLAQGTESSAFHLPSAFGYFMEQSLEVKGTYKNGDVTQTIYISDDFHADSVDGYRLK